MATQPISSAPIEANGSCEPASSPGRRAQHVALAVLLLGALLIRVAAAAGFRNIIWPDEIFQAIEPAHHLAIGPWMASWEWAVGMRSWLVPGLLAGPLWLGHQLDPAGSSGTLLVTGAMLVLSLAPVLTGYLWGSRLRGTAGGLIVGGTAAVWPDLVLMAPHPLVDVLASHTLVIALYCAFPLTTRPSGRRLVAAAALLGVTAYLRLQLAPAAAVACLLASRGSPGAWRALAGGLAGALLALALFDQATLGFPLQSVWLNFWFNIVGGIGEQYGTASPLYYLTLLVRHWGLFLPVAAAILILNAGRHGALLAVAAVLFLTLSGIAHKEWRFMFPFLTVAIILVSLKLLDLAPALAQRVGTRVLSPNVQGVMALVGIALVAAALGRGAGYAEDRTRNRGMLLAFDRLRTEPRVCGVGIHYLTGKAERESWVFGPGSAALRPGVPQYAADASDGWRAAAAYNALVVADGATPPPPFTRTACFGAGSGNPLVPGAETCLWQRPGGCDRTAAQPPQPNWPPYFLDARGHVRTERAFPLRDLLGAGAASPGESRAGAAVR